MSIEPLAMSPGDFAKALGVSRAFVYQEIKAGRIVARKWQRRTLVFLADNETLAGRLPRFEEVEPPKMPRGRRRARS